jgi:sortase (surface protein transpeptidase)
MQRVLGAALVIAGLGVAGFVAVDDTGDDIGELSIDAATPAAAPAETASPSAPPSDDPSTPTPSAPPSTAAPEQPVAATPSPSPAPSPRPAAPEIGVSSARITDVDLSPPPAPVDIALPSIGVDAPIVPVGVDPDGLMGVPEDVDEVGWYRWGSAPGSGEGTIVLAGHVDSRSQGRGAFFDLRVMQVGDEVTVLDEEGTETTWRVTGRRTYDKASLPVDELYRRDGQPRLLLITCGGDFDADARSYRSNVVVEAELVT